MKTDDYETNEPLETTVLEVLKQMLQLGVHISKQVRDLSGMGGSWHSAASRFNLKFKFYQS